MRNWVDGEIVELTYVMGAWSFDGAIQAPKVVIDGTYMVRASSVDVGRVSWRRRPDKVLDSLIIILACMQCPDLTPAARIDVRPVSGRDTLHARNMSFPNKLLV